MDARTLVGRLRDHYVDQFRAFADEQRHTHQTGASEVKLLLSERSILFRRLYCVDFIANSEAPMITELIPDRVLKFDAISGAFGRAELSIEHLQWDAVGIDHDLDAAPPDALDAWFERWFDPEDKRHGENATLSLTIHSLLVERGSLSIDFGTSPPDAFWEMLELLEAAGASTIAVRTSREENAAGASGSA
jgi:hypothetical protein